MLFRCLLKTLDPIHAHGAYLGDQFLDFAQDPPGGCPAAGTNLTIDDPTSGVKHFALHVLCVVCIMQVMVAHGA